MDQPVPDLYTLALAKAGQIETELRRLGRWNSHPPAPEKFESMGAFGTGTLSFEQWIQFVLIPRIQKIVKGKGEFPDESAVATYAVRYFDGDPDTEDLHQLLWELDKLIEGKPQSNGFSYLATEDAGQPLSSAIDPSYQKFNYGDSTVPPVLTTLANLLCEYEGDALESQLQTFDTFLSVLAPPVRPEVSKLLYETGKKCSNEAVRMRILQASTDVANGNRAAEPYDHEAAMKKYMEDFKRSFPKGV